MGTHCLLFIVLDLIYVHLSLLILFTSPLPSLFIAINLRFISSSSYFLFVCVFNCTASCVNDISILIVFSFVTL
ncbi:hypothetical protein V1527DRAFT_19924 [Lipomyces starkeyi]